MVVIGEPNPLPLGSVGTWRFITGPRVASLTQFGNYASLFNMTVAGPYVFSWEVTRPGCPPQVSQVVITRVASPTVAQAGSAQTICGTSTTLTGNTPVVGVGTWSFVTGPRVASVSQSGTVATVAGMTQPGD